MLNLRTLIFVVGIGLFFILFYYYNESQQILAKWGRERDKCQQSLDAISAQLQVVYEHKSRLEKSLQSEKDNAMKEKTENEKRLRLAKANNEQQKVESTKLSEKMRQQQSDFQKQLDELQDKYASLQRNFDELSESKQNFELKNQQALEEAKRQQKEAEFQMISLREELERLKVENSQLKNQLLHASSTNNASTMFKSSSSVSNFAQSASNKNLASNDGTRLTAEDLWQKNSASAAVKILNSSISQQLDPFLTNGSSASKNQSSKETDEIQQLEKPIPLEQQDGQFDKQAQIDDRHRNNIDDDISNRNVNNQKRDNVDPPVLKHPMNEEQQNMLEKEKAKQKDLVEKRHKEKSKDANENVLPAPGKLDKALEVGENRDIVDRAAPGRRAAVNEDDNVDGKIFDGNRKGRMMKNPDYFKMHEDAEDDKDFKNDQEKYDQEDKKDIREDDDML